MGIDIPTPEPGEEKDQAKQRLNNTVAITIVLLVTLMGIFKVKDDNICQAMQQAQANKIDAWSWYQARNIREEVLHSASLQLDAQGKLQPSGQAVLSEQSKTFRALAKDQNIKKAKLQKEAQGYDDEYNALNFRDDQFDLSDALLSIAVAMLAVTSLVQKRWLYLLSLFPSAFGIIMGFAGFFGWAIHPDALAKFLGT